MEEQLNLFIFMVFLTVFCLMAGLTMPVFGENAGARRRMKSRALQMSVEHSEAARAIELRKDPYQGLPPLVKQIESMESLARLRAYIDQSGNGYRAYQVVLASLLMATIGGFIAYLTLHTWFLALLAAAALSTLPFAKIARDRGKRMDRFEEQLPDAIDVMRRALQAGHPFNESLNLVAMELDNPIQQA